MTQTPILIHRLGVIINVADCGKNLLHYRHEKLRVSGFWLDAIANAVQAGALLNVGY